MKLMATITAPKNDEKRLGHWLGMVARAAREKTGLSPEQIAPAPGLRVNSSTLRKFEAGKALPRELDRVLSAYAYMGAYDDERALIAEALRLWWDNGTPRDIPEELRRYLDGFLNDEEPDL